MTLIRLLLQKRRLVLLCCGSHAWKGKAPFNEWDGHGWYTDVRTQKVKDCPDTPEGVYDEDCPELEKLGVRYLAEEDAE